MATIPSSLLRSPLRILRSWELHHLTLKGGRFHRPLTQPLAAQENRRGLMSIGYFNHDIKYGRKLYLESPMAGPLRHLIVSPEINNKLRSFPEFENGNLKWEGSTPHKSGWAYLHIEDGYGRNAAQAGHTVKVHCKHYDITCKDKNNSYRVKKTEDLDFCLGDDKYSEFQFVIYGMKAGDIRRMAIRHNLSKPEKLTDWEVYDVKLLGISLED